MGFLSFYSVAQVDATSDDIDELVFLWTKGQAEHGNAEAQFDLGGMYYRGPRCSAGL